MILKLFTKDLNLEKKLSEIVHVGKLDLTEHSRIFISNEKNDLNEFKEKIDKVLNYLGDDNSKLYKFIKTDFPNIKDI